MSGRGTGKRRSPRKNNRALSNRGRGRAKKGAAAAAAAATAVVQVGRGPGAEEGDGQGGPGGPGGDHSGDDEEVDRRPRPRVLGEAAEIGRSLGIVNCDLSGPEELGDSWTRKYFLKYFSVK